MAQRCGCKGPIPFFCFRAFLILQGMEPNFDFRQCWRASCAHGSHKQITVSWPSPHTVITVALLSRRQNITVSTSSNVAPAATAHMLQSWRSPPHPITITVGNAITSSFHPALTRPIGTNGCPGEVPNGSKTRHKILHPVVGFRCSTMKPRSRVEILSCGFCSTESVGISWCTRFFSWGRDLSHCFGCLQPFAHISVQYLLLELRSGIVPVCSASTILILQSPPIQGNVYSHVVRQLSSDSVACSCEV